MSRHSTIYVLALCLILPGSSLQSAQNTSSQGGNQGGDNAPKGRPFTLPDLADTPKTPPKPPGTSTGRTSGRTAGHPPATPPATTAPGTAAPVTPAPVTASPVREGSFADAAYLTQKGFLAAVKDVAVAIHAPRATTQDVPESELQADVAAALDDYGIAVRPNSSVRLDVTVVQKDTRFIWNDDDSDTQDMHDILVVLSFQTTGVARRGTKLYPIVAAAAQSEMVGTVTQNNSTRRLFFGDETRADMQKQLASLIAGTLKTVSQNDNVDTTPWYAAKWTEAQKAAANGEFATLMKGTTVAADHFAGLDVLPTVTSDTSNDGSGMSPAGALQRGMAAGVCRHRLDEDVGRDPSVARARAPVHLRRYLQHAEVHAHLELGRSARAELRVRAQRPCVSQARRDSVVERAHDRRRRRRHGG